MDTREKSPRPDRRCARSGLLRGLRIAAQVGVNPISFDYYKIGPIDTIGIVKSAVSSSAQMRSRRFNEE
jgi:hypothetical protein